MVPIIMIWIACIVDHHWALGFESQVRLGSLSPHSGDSESNRTHGDSIIYYYILFNVLLFIIVLILILKSVSKLQPVRPGTRSGPYRYRRSSFLPEHSRRLWYSLRWGRCNAKETKTRRWRSSRTFVEILQVAESSDAGSNLYVRCVSPRRTCPTSDCTSRPSSVLSWSHHDPVNKKNKCTQTNVGRHGDQMMRCTLRALRNILQLWILFFPPRGS